MSEHDETNGLPAILRAWRERAKLSQPQAAARLGAPVRSYRNWETGRRVPGAATRAAIAAVTDERSGQ